MANVVIVDTDFASMYSRVTWYVTDDALHNFAEKKGCVTKYNIPNGQEIKFRRFNSVNFA